MPDYKPDDESALRAERVSTRLMDALGEVAELGPQAEMRRELFSEQRYSEETEGVPIGDVLDNVSRMAVEFAIARRWDGAIACLKLETGDIAPISWTEFFGGPSSQVYGSENWFEFWDKYFAGPFPLHRAWRDAMKDFARQESAFTVTDVREVGASIQRALSQFLSYRFAGMKRWFDWSRRGGTFPPIWPFRRRGKPPLPPLSDGGGLRVRVSCKTRGLRIHVSPAYFVNWVYFGSPTSPVVSYVLPGRYIFAGDGPMMPKRRTDPTVFCIPADYNPQLKRF
jgi:hypothetical protein